LCELASAQAAVNNDNKINEETTEDVRKVPVVEVCFDMFSIEHISYVTLLIVGSSSSADETKTRVNSGDDDDDS
jgi:hypothetical protein